MVAFRLFRLWVQKHPGADRGMLIKEAIGSVLLTHGFTNNYQVVYKPLLAARNLFERNGGGREIRRVWLLSQLGRAFPLQVPMDAEHVLNQSESFLLIQMAVTTEVKAVEQGPAWESCLVLMCHASLGVKHDLNIVMQPATWLKAWGYDGL